MSIELKTVEFPKSARAVTSKYPFADLVVGGPAIIDTEVVDRAKAQSRMTSALVAYRKRSKDTSTFKVRTFKQEDGTDAVGVWKTA